MLAISLGSDLGLHCGRRQMTLKGDLFRSGSQSPGRIHITGLSSRAMFCNDLKEKYEKRIIIKGVDAETMHILLNYTYTSKALITKHNVQRVLEAANLFQVCD